MKLKLKTTTKAGWINPALIPLKQHVICCGILPAVGSLVGGGAAAQFLHSPAVEWALGITMPPLVTYGVMVAEQQWRDRRAKTNPCACTQRTLTLKNYFLQTALGYTFYAAAHFLLPHEHHDQPKNAQQTTLCKQVQTKDQAHECH